MKCISTELRYQYAHFPAAKEITNFIIKHSPFRLMIRISHESGRKITGNK